MSAMNTGSHTLNGTCDDDPSDDYPVDDYAPPMPAWMEHAGIAVPVVVTALGTLLVAEQATRHMPSWALRILAALALWFFLGGAVLVGCALSETQRAEHRERLRRADRELQGRA